MQSWKPHDDALMVAINYKHGLPKSTASSDRTMKIYRDVWDTKPTEAIWKRLDYLYRSGALDDPGAILDVLTDEERDKYLPGFGTMGGLAHKKDWGRTDTDFDYANRKGGGKFIQSMEKVASQKSKYGDVDDEEWQEELGENGIAKANPVAKVKIG